MPSLYEQVVDCCGLAPDFARRIISQACERAGVAAEEMGPSELIRALPHIQQAFAVFLEPREVQRKVGAMRRLVQSSWPSLPAVVVPGDEGRAGQDGPNTKSTS